MAFSEPPEPIAKPSKTRLKQAMQALQDLGEQLVALTPEQLGRIALPEELRDAVREAARITKHEGRRRQLQYIGRLMRKVDAEPIRAALSAIEGTSRVEMARQRRVERLRERLLEDETVLAEIAASRPGVDLQPLRTLRRNVLKERELGKPPRRYRELFRALREIDQDAQEAFHDGE